MAIFDDALVSVILADYIGIDAGGKVNALGAGFTLTALQPNGLTAPQHVVAIIDVSPKYADEEFALLLELRDMTDDTAVIVPGPSGGTEPLRVQQLAKVQRPSAPGLYLPPTMFCRVQMTIGFPSGLPLQAGHAYAWRIEIDGQHRKQWRAQFQVLGGPPPPVFGGPAGPSSIPNIAPVMPPEADGDAGTAPAD